MYCSSDFIERAKQETGLSKLGEDSFREGLEVLLKAAAQEARLNELGRSMFEGNVLSLLKKRLQVEDWYARHPEIDEQEIVSPLFGLALPRTGSTALACTLAEDPAVRSLRMWECNQPCPPPEKATENTDPRIALDDQRRATIGDKLFPRMKIMVPTGATTVAECSGLMTMDFASWEFCAKLQIPTYADWMVNKADMVQTYRWLKRVLKLLQWRCPPNRWRLKSPTHMPFVNALNEVFPDARFWWTHRDITRVVPSAVDLYHELQRPSTDELDPAYVISAVVDFWDLGIKRMIEFRDSGNEHRFVDIQFEQFQADPVACVQQIYDFMGEELTQVARDRMAQWRQDMARGKHGKHELDTIAAGLDLAAIGERFRIYNERFTA